MNYFLISSIGNIGHFFHENLFYALDSYLHNKNIIWVLHTNLTEWELQFTTLCIKHLKISYTFHNLTNYRTGLPYVINLSPNFNIILQLIQEIIKKEYPDTKFNGNYKVLYFRNDASRRKMLGYKGNIDIYFDEIVNDMSSLSFEKQVKLFMKCSHFVTIEGAHLTNIIFMNKKAKVLDISPTNNSWQLMFGTSQCVDVFHNFILNLDNFNSNIQYDEKIENEIKLFLGHSNFIMDLFKYIFEM